MKKEQPVLDFLDQIFRVGVGFGKAQLIMLGVNFLIICAGLLIIGLGWWSVVLALVVALLDLLPVLGAGLVLLPWAFIALLLDQGSQALGLGLIYLAMVLARVTLDPLITGRHIGVPPLLTLAAALLGLIFLGGVGMIVGPILAAVVSIIYRMQKKKGQ